ncbi:glycosyl hydrolase [Geopyxis carbonaria]|nr:glycosyl hydrolase [Geopyxis carbonaria]
MLFTNLLAAAFTGLVGLVAAQTPGACTGTCQGYSHDPSVIRRVSDGTYFRFSTGNKISVATAPALSGPWTLTGSALPSGSKINLSGNQGKPSVNSQRPRAFHLWAPDINGPIGGYYYLYYSVSTFGSQASAIGVARSTTMDVGTWTDLGATGIASSSGSAYNAIDGNLVATASGGYAMTFGSFWSDLYQVPMASTPTATAGTSVQVAYNGTGSHALEGPYVFYRSGYYYLFFSSGVCCGYDSSRPAQGEEYRINVCRSTSVNSGYVDKNGKSCTSGGGSTVLASHGNVYGPGGQGVFADTNSGGTILYYHYVNTNVGYADGQKTFGWNVLSWSTGWPVAT